MSQERKIGTSFRSPEYIAKMGLDEARVLTDLESFAGVNADVQPYTEAESQETANRFQSLAGDGLNGVIHVVTSPFTTQFLRAGIPPEDFKKLR